MDKNLTNYLNSFPTLKLTIFEDKKILLIEINREKTLNAMNAQFS